MMCKHPTAMQHLDKDSLFSYLQLCPATDNYLLAISGGLDSSVMLHLFYQNRSRIQQKLEAVYVDHNLQAASAEWEETCARQTEDYGITFHAIRIAASPARTDSIENWARTERYARLTERMQQNAILFTAHHLDDQVETFFLQAFRGTGSRGLAAMAPFRQLGCGYHARPLLAFNRQQLLEYALQQGLSWVEDPSNADNRFDRNYLRHEVLSRVEPRWPGYRKTISRLIEHQAETREVLEELAEHDLACLLDDAGQGLVLSKVRELSVPRQKNVIQHWARKKQLALPGSVHLRQIISDVMNAEEDACPCVNWKDVECRRYRDTLFLDRCPLPHDPDAILNWDMQQQLEIHGETLSAISSPGKGLAREYLARKTVSIRFRQGGERICPAPGTRHKTLKQIYQETGVLPWCRDRIPLVYLDDELAAVPGICVATRFSASGKAAAVTLQWSGLQKCRRANG